MSIFLVVQVSAGIYFSQPEQTYNLGDTIINNININPIEEGFLSVDLVCGGNSVNVFNGVPIDGQANIEFPLTTAYIQNISGNCFFLAIQGDAVQESRKFQVSKTLIVRLSIDSLFAKPGEEVTISGNVEKLNGIGINGEVEIDIPLLSLMEVEIDINETDEDTDNNETDINETDEDTESEVVVIYDSGKFYGEVVGGAFSVTFTLANDMPAGDYRVDVLGYEELSGSRTSEGVAIANLKISQVLTKVDIVLGLQSLDPGQDFSFKPRLLDQSDRIIEKEVSVIIRDENLNRIFEQIVISEETINYNIPTNMSAGYYEIEVSNEGKNEIKKFYINEREIISLELLEGVVVVTNIGNMELKDYPIQIELNGKPFVKKVDLRLGEKQEFKLTGDGTYDVKISDGSQEISSSGVVLTGNAVGIKNIKGAGSIAMSTPIIWIFLIIIIGGVVLFFFRDTFKKKSFAYPFKGKIKDKLKFSRKPRILELKSSKKVESSGEVKSSKKEDKKESKKEEKSEVVNKGRAESVLVLDGQRSKATVIILKIKNKLTKTSKQSLEKAIEHVYEKKAAVYERGDNIFIIFSPLMTKTFKNEKNAAKAAEKILSVLKNHNKRFKEKIEFGIGIHSGDVINKVVDKKLKFTALGNLLPGAKRLADASDGKILMTKETYEAAISDIKAVKKNTKDGEVYEVQRVVDKEQNKVFIDGFLGRMAKEAKKSKD